MTADATWLPNLVGGTSIWKLAVDLNEAKFFDGRLLVPETEGSESLPVTVRWDLTGLIPLAEATAKHPFETNQAIQEFQAALDRVAVVFKTPNSGFDKYKAAFTVPSLEADGGGNYFYSPEQKKLHVINWGASPRSMGGKAEYVFGYEDWGKKFEDKTAVPAAPALAPVAAAAAVGGAAVAAAAAVEAPKEEKKEEPKKTEEKKKKPWWAWLIFALVVVGIVLLVLFLLKACDEPKGVSADAAAEAAALEAGADAATDAGVDAAALSDAGDAGDAGALSDAGDAGALSDAGSDAGKDGGLAMNDDDDDDGPAGGGGGGGAGGGGGGGPVTVTIGPAGGGTGPKAGPHRKHYMDQAQAWRVSGGKQKVSRTEQSGHRYDVWLGAGQTFEGVRVEWQDSAGKWHVH